MSSLVPAPAHYSAAHRAAVLVERSPRALMDVTGRSPSRMLDGMVTAGIPAAFQRLEADGSATLRGRLSYSAMLTPKGRMVTDLRIGRIGSGDDDERLLLDVPGGGLELARAHFAKYLPPRFARVEPLAESFGCASLVGPDAATALARVLSGRGHEVGPEILSEMEEGACLLVPAGSVDLGLAVVRSGDTIPPAFELIGAAEALAEWTADLEDAGVPRAGSDLWTLLRLERGRPEFGIEMDEETLLPEAGIHRRAVGASKGCYTGQEVVVRIRDRGHVNRHLRGLLLGSRELPDPGTELFDRESGRAVGEIRSAAMSPRFDRAIALGYVRRGVEPPGRVRVGDPDGPEAGVRALTDEGWTLLEEDTPAGAV